jgi:hypothetical protein
MAVRAGRGARLRRAGLGRPLALLTALYAAAAVAATWPAITSFRSAFMANHRLSAGEPPAGDHLQSVYRFWLVGHQVEHGEAPWKDAYSFQPLVEPQTVVGGWPFGFPFWPIEAVFGPVVAWNLLLLATIVGAGLFTYLWLRCLELGLWPAAIGGLVFALAPYRLEQSAGHLLGWAAIFLPLALWAIERARSSSSRGRAHAWGALAALAIVSVPLSGQVHLALGAIPLAIAYAALRYRRVAFSWTLGGALGGIGVGLLIRYTLIAGSAEAGGRSTAELRRYSAEPLDFLNRWHEPGSEEFVYLGWLTLALAIVGVVALFRRNRGLAVLLGLAAVVPIVLAFGINLPGYAAVWRNFSPLHFTRVPERVLPIANLALGALAAFACAGALQRAGRRASSVACALIVLVALDLTVQPFSAAAADPGNKAYARLADGPPGRVLELPLFEPGVHYGSVYPRAEGGARLLPRARPPELRRLAPGRRRRARDPRHHAHRLPPRALYAGAPSRPRLRRVRPLGRRLAPERRRRADNAVGPGGGQSSRVLSRPPASGPASALHRLARAHDDRTGSDDLGLRDGSATPPLRVGLANAPADVRRRPGRGSDLVRRPRRRRGEPHRRRVAFDRADRVAARRAPRRHRALIRSPGRRS